MLRHLPGIAFRFCARVILVAAVLPVLYVIEPVFRIRLGTMYTQRMGHLLLNADCFLRRMRDSGPPRRTLYLFFGVNPVNRQIFEMWKRLEGFPVRFLESRWGTRLAFAWRPILKRTRFWEEKRLLTPEYELYGRTPPILSLTEKEERKGRAGLDEMGIGVDDWFVLFHARDGSFLRQWRPDLTEVWETRDFRNSDIKTYLKAAEYIASLGGYALRMGVVVEEALPDTGNPRIIDYATKYRSDFMDIYLGAKCRFFIGSASGPDALANIFNIPLLTANHIPYNYTRFHRQSIIIPRLIVTPDDRRPVPFWQAQEAGFYTGWKEASSGHENMGLFDTVASDASDILDGVKDMIDGFEGRRPPPEAREIQDIYGKLYLSHIPGYEHGGKVGARFAVKYRHLIAPPTTAADGAPPGAGHQQGLDRVTP